MALNSEPLLEVLLRVGAVIVGSFGAKRKTGLSLGQVFLSAAAALMFGVAFIFALIALFREIEWRYGPVWVPLSVTAALLLIGAALIGAASLCRPRPAPAPLPVPVEMPKAPLETLIQKLPPGMQALARDPHLRLLILSFLSGALAARRPERH